MDSDNYLLKNKWSIAIGTTLAVGAVIFAATTGRKGKFWWWIGGSIVGGSIGRLIDAGSKQNAVTEKQTPS